MKRAIVALVVAQAFRPAIAGLKPCATTVQAAAVRDYPIRAVPLTRVRLTDNFWRPRLDTNRTVTIPHIFRQNELTGRTDNFLNAAHKIEGIRRR